MGDVNVLYLDDEPDLLDLAAGFFEDDNISLHTSSDFDKAIDLVRRNDYAVILSDARMPSGSGHEFFRYLRNELNFKGKLILVTGNLEAKGVKEKTGYDAVIYKPINFQELVEAVNIYLGR